MSASAPHATSEDDLPRALAWMVLSGLSFALMAAAVKLSGDAPLAAKVGFRNLVTLGITSAVALRRRCNPFGPTPYLSVLLLRSLCGLAGVTLYFLALRHLPLADASLLNKTSPFFVTLGAVVLLKERLNRTVIPALGVAFVGAALVIRPHFDGATLPALAGLGSGAFAGTAYVLVRSLKGRADPNRIVFYFSLISVAATAPLLLLDPPQPTPGQWLALVATGVFAAGGQYGLTYAYHHARASRVAIFAYLHVLFALVLGAVFFGEIPGPASLAGGVLIVGAAVWSHRAASDEAAAGRGR